MIYQKLIWIGTLKLLPTVFLEMFFGVTSSLFLTECSNHLKLCLPVEKKFIDKFVKDLYVDHATTEVKKGGGRKNVLGESKGYFMKRKN